MTDAPPKPAVSDTRAEPNGVATEGPLLAAIDLGSNSFNLLICRWQGQKLTKVAHCKQIVQLVRKADSNGNLNATAVKRALKSLREFGTILQQHKPHYIDIIGTEALRKAPNGSGFLVEAEELLGSQVALISEQKEAELGYFGVQYYQQPQPRALLVVDIGGASTELTIGCQQNIQYWHSLKLGCVSLTNQFFAVPGRRSRVKKVSDSYAYCCNVIDDIKDPFLQQGWQITLGASGIMRVIADLLPGKPDSIDRSDLATLLHAIENDRELQDSIPANLRRDVLPAGIVLLSAIFDSLHIDRLQVSPGNVKHGLILERIRKLDGNAYSGEPLPVGAP
ncbi:MAG: hypothetical protein GYB33_17600 [Gammaproteobacteria bacterium]|uniref:Ppx/GppA phosphatase family protein n=1 Tax=Pseudomaricurvus alcaniphilus TaxID=1166482 RepID=UPI00140D7129|nr:hypothetical protein [Pseudomaricurvus alcaniphilus]MBR9912160.1 hypothetical protein [Gammaproteobacteria bacterium]NHN35700.1 hypothetical protein [Pseudomaricurvus alcaniphilus]